MLSYAIIPARIGSTRLKNKLLLRDTGYSLIYHTFKNAMDATKISGVCVATDSEEVFAEVESFGGFALMTSPDHECGSDRVAEAVEILSVHGHESFCSADSIINLQADEPSLSGSDLDILVNTLHSTNSNIASLYFEITDEDKILDPNRVKVVVDDNNKALYFSRHAIPYGVEWSLNVDNTACYYQHVGVYAFRDYRKLGYPRGMLEQAENLEQLRWLERGWDIAMGKISHESNGIDTQKDYDLFVESWKASNE